ncbi:matrixin family metalloprotease [Curtobacterium sp. ISL-83]|uniref:matrixin family metalloprotease n=1 Tax=Curtobacterium sp. ISL-83 TaxID=2819145 RepID=UPI001BEA561A|nr:matrixin family metalloprotease [Curtobacterium sp. ISL-83]MBT2502240.1 matrixin family metalloprotease [Curtobacterium sp. ISL-83]
MRTTSATAGAVAIGIALSAVVTTSVGAAPAVAGTTSSCTGSTITVDALSTGCAVSSGTVVLPDGRRFAVPSAGTTVSSLPVAAVGAADPGDVSLTNTGRSGIAVAVDGSWSGSEAAVRKQRAVEQHRRSLTVSGPMAATTTTTTPASSCTNRTYTLLGYHWNAPVQWRSNSTGAKATDVAAIRAGADAWTGTISTCGRTITSGARDTYLGGTTQAPAVSATGGCGASNGTSVTGWGPLKAGTLATTCVWSRGGVAVEVDQRYTTAYAWSSASTCSGTRFDLRGVATHEWGHAYGLGHTLQTSGLVMKPASSPCDLGQRRLGLGDAFGIDTVY